MVLNINYYNGTPLTSVQNGTFNTTATSLALLGEQVVNFGLALNNNFVALLQHFANTSPPPNPIQGQIWFSTVDQILRVYSGTAWLAIPLPFDGNAGTAIVAITAEISVVITLSCGVIISCVSQLYVPPADLPTTVNIADVTYQFASLFENGLSAGITLAINPNGYQFSGTASTANVLTTARNITLNGSVTGNVYFDGSNDVVITNSLINALQGSVVSNASVSLPNWFTNVYVNSNGIVSDATTLIDNDVINALGFIPPSQIIIQGDATGVSIPNGNVFTTNVNLSASNVTPGNYNNVTVDYAGRVQFGTYDYPIQINGIILWYSQLIPNNWALCDGTTVPTPNGLFTTPDLTSDFVGPTRYIIRVS